MAHNSVLCDIDDASAEGHLTVVISGLADFYSRTAQIVGSG